MKRGAGYADINIFFGQILKDPHGVLKNFGPFLDYDIQHNIYVK